MVCCLVVRSQRRQTEESPVCDINDMERWRLERGLHALTPPSPLSSSPVSSPLLLLPSPFLSPFHLFHLVSSTSHIFHYTSTPPSSFPLLSLTPDSLCLLATSPWLMFFTMLSVCQGQTQSPEETRRMGAGSGIKKTKQKLWNFVVAGISSVHLSDKVLYGGCYCHAVHVWTIKGFRLKCSTGSPLLNAFSFILS